MKIPFFTKKEDYIAYLKDRIRMVEKACNEWADKADALLKNEGRAAWLETNMIKEGTQEAEAAWQKHINWACDYWKNKRRELKKLRTMLKEVNG